MHRDPAGNNQGKFYQGYRQDCSGFVSMAWERVVSGSGDRLHRDR